MSRSRALKASREASNVTGPLQGSTLRTTTWNPAARRSRTVGPQRLVDVGGGEALAEVAAAGQDDAQVEVGLGPIPRVDLEGRVGEHVGDPGAARGRDVTHADVRHHGERLCRELEAGVRTVTGDDAAAVPDHHGRPEEGRVAAVARLHAQQAGVGGSVVQGETGGERTGRRSQRSDRQQPERQRDAGDVATLRRGSSHVPPPNTREHGATAPAPSVHGAAGGA